MSLEFYKYLEAKLLQTQHHWSRYVFSNQQPNQIFPVASEHRANDAEVV